MKRRREKKNDLQLQFGSIFPATRFAQSKFRNFFRELWILKFFGSSTWYKAIFPAYVLVFRDWHPPPLFIKKMKNNKNKCLVRVSTDLSLFPVIKLIAT
jgi:hypothetical protein